MGKTPWVCAVNARQDDTPAAGFANGVPAGNHVFSLGRRFGLARGRDGAIAGRDSQGRVAWQLAVGPAKVWGMSDLPNRDEATLGLTDDGQVGGETAASLARPARPKPEHGAADETIRTFALEAARTCHDLHCEEVLVLDVRGLSQITDYILIASGTSDRQIRSVAHDLEKLGAEHGLKRFGSERDERTLWVVVDFVDVVVHLFEPATRGHYDLEMLWGDAVQVKWRR
jgi:ribosome-associated protein